jgi:nicotinate-nucleotide adenylyltransferase
MSKKQHRIGVFGGSFDPVHTGHVLIAKAAVEQLKLDRLVFVPARRSPHKPRLRQAPSVHRLSMVKKVVRMHGRWEYDDVELYRRGPSYTTDTIDHFSGTYPGALLYLLIGSDNLRSFSTWKDPRVISERTKIIVYKRWGHQIRKTDVSRWNASVLRGPEIFISSTNIRSRIVRGRTIRYFVPLPVERYIKEHSLYRRERTGT